MHGPTTSDVSHPTVSSSDIFSPSVQDLVSARDACRRFFPLEIVFRILDLADYWVRTTSARAHWHRVCTFNSHGYDAALCSLVTAPVLGRARQGSETDDIRLKVMRVKFTTISHDPGVNWNVRGAYPEINASWFEAAILRPSLMPGGTVPVATPAPYEWLTGAADSPTTPPCQWLTRAIASPIPMLAIDGYSPSIEVRDASGSSRWTVQRNHTVTWGADNAATLGAGDGEGFLEKLEPGDRIAVIARALHPGRCNHVRRVEVSVYYSLA
ncbi:hypothetical protein B0H13DRAFT_1900232 [Mycena leptocephala]|nr:hypothetical protein B0H13DRAFT_1900232 [Mycena leptocephala]